MRKLLLVSSMGALGAMVAGSALAAQYVVVDAKGSIADLLKPGALIDDASLDVPANDKLTLMGGDGLEIEVDGPHKGEIGQAAHSDNGVLAKISEAMQERPGVLGTTRPITMPVLPPPVMDDPWAVDIMRGGTACFFDGRKPTLWKPATPDAVSVTIRDAAINKGTDFQWPANQATLPWPSAVPIVDGDRYTIQVGDKHRAITLKTVEAAKSAGLGSIYAANAGCSVQAASLLKSAKPSRVIPPS
jgi:hypothetical protein